MQDQLSQMGESIDVHNEQMALMAEAEKMNFAEMSIAVTNYVNHYIAEMARMREAAKQGNRGSDSSSSSSSSSKSINSYATGRIGGKAEDAIVDEYGKKEIIARNVGGRITRLEYGDSVLPFDKSKILYDAMMGAPIDIQSKMIGFKQSPIANVSSTVNNLPSFTIGDVNIHNPVGDVNALAKGIIAKLPNRIIQTAFRR